MSTQDVIVPILLSVTPGILEGDGARLAKGVNTDHV
jgi:hypothetical protein